MKYNERYEIEETKNGSILIYDTELDTYLCKPIAYACHVQSSIDRYEYNLAESAWYRSTQEGTSQAERDEQHHNYQNLK